MSLVSLLGLAGGLCFAWAAVPAAIDCIRNWRPSGTPSFIALLIVLGTIFLYSYLYLSYGFDLILTINYALEFVSWSIVLFFALKEEN